MTSIKPDRLVAATSDRRLLDHPFYKAWAAGTLTVEDLREYSKQYWRQVEAFPGYLQKVGSRISDDRARGIIASNLGDEIDGDHQGLWLDFAKALGTAESEVRASSANPHTESCVKAFDDACANSDVGFALGMLWGYESQTPEVAQTKVEGLRGHYGIDGDGVTYFELHGELDVEHADELVEAINREVGVDAAETVAAGARAGAEAIWGLLDGVCETRGISC
ncbi:MAG: pyrroloquinoline-quinone synthase [Actinomycetota bacterium]|jgi:pyrroloquinoline-quinone synthase|nr:pyrroloquinoline-quinone synthase [Actinomycetota bacterium]